MDTLEQMSHYFLDFIIANCMIPTKIEGWTIIIDLTHMGLTHLPRKLLKGIIGAMQKNWRGRLFRMFGLNVHWLVRGLFKVVSTWLDEFTTTKINMLGSEFQRHLHEVIDENSLEEKYGGKLPNKTGEYFPPQLK